MFTYYFQLLTESVHRVPVAFTSQRSSELRSPTAIRSQSVCASLLMETSGPISVCLTAGVGFRLLISLSHSNCRLPIPYISICLTANVDFQSPVCVSHCRCILPIPNLSGSLPTPYLPVSLQMSTSDPIYIYLFHCECRLPIPCLSVSLQLYTSDF